MGIQATNKSKTWESSKAKSTMLSLYSPRQSVLTHPFFSSSDPFESIFGDRFDHFDLIPFNNNSNNVNSITMSNMSNIQVDLIEHDDGYQVKADLPGMKKEDITVNLNDKTNVLTISAEKKDEINQDTDTYKRREKKRRREEEKKRRREEERKRRREEEKEKKRRREEEKKRELETMVILYSGNTH